MSHTLRGMGERSPDLTQMQALIQAKEQELRDAHDFQVRNLEVKLMQRTKDLELTLDQLKHTKAAFHRLREDFTYNLQLIENRDAELTDFEEKVQGLEGKLHEQSSIIDDLQNRLADREAQWHQSEASASAKQEAVEQAKALAAKEMSDTKAALEAQIVSLSKQLGVVEQATAMQVKSLESQLATTEADCERKIADVRAEANKITPSILYDEHVTQLQLELKEANLVSQQLQRRLQTATWELQEQQERADLESENARSRLREVEQARDNTLEDYEAKMARLVASLREVEGNFVEQRRQFEVALETQATQLKQEFSDRLEAELEKAVARGRADAANELGRDIAEIEAQQAARVSELRAELQEAAVATKQQAHLTSMAEQNYEATIAMRDARVAAAVEETERLRKSLEAAGEAERKLREELQKRGEELLDVEQGWKRRLSNAGENFEDKERHLQREVSRMTNDKNELQERFSAMKAELESLRDLNVALSDKANQAVEEQQSLIESRTRQLQRDLNLREKELATAKKDLAAAESESRAARMEAERVRVLTDERDAAVADLTRQLAHANTELLMERQRRLRQPTPFNPSEIATDNASRNKRRAQLSVLTGQSSRSPSPSSASPRHKPHDGEAARTLNDALDEKFRRQVSQSSGDKILADRGAAPPLPAAPKPAESPLFSGDFGPVDESLGLHLSSDTLTLPPSPAKREHHGQRKSTNPGGTGSTDEDDMDDSDFEYGLDSAKSAQSFQVRHALGNRLSRSLATLKEHVHGADRATQQAAAAALGSPVSGTRKIDADAVAEENESLRATVGMMKDEMLRMKNELLAASPPISASGSAKQRLSTGVAASSSALQEEVKRLQAERQALLENGKMLKSALRKATSAASNGALLEATSTYSAELESVKKNFETLKRGLSAQQVVLSPAPKHSDFGRQGGQRRRGDAQRPMHHTNRHASRSSRSLQTTSAPAPATNARQERGVRTVSQRTTSSQREALEKIRQKNAARTSAPASRVPRNYNDLRD